MFPRFSVLCLSAAWVQICARMKSIFSLSLCLSVCISVSGLAVLRKDFDLSSLNNREIIPWGEGTETLQSLTNFYKALSPWLALVPADPDHRHHCLSTNIHQWMLSTFMVALRKLLSTSGFAASSKCCTGIVLRQGHGRAQNLRPQRCICLGCKSWLHGKSQARKAGYYTALVEAG